METIIHYNELEQLTGNKIKFTRVSEDTIKLSGRINLLVISKELSETLKIERVGYSSVDLSVSNISIVKSGLILFLPKNLKNSISIIEEKKIKINLKAIPELSEIVKKVKLDSFKFEESGITIKVSPRT